MTTAGLACRPGGRRLGRAVRGAALSGACLAGVAAAGAVVSSRATYPRPREAERVGRELAYPGWHPGAPAGMPAQRAAPGDLSYALTAAFPWFRPTVGIGLVTGVGEIDAAAAFDTCAGNSHAARAVPIAAGCTVTTRHGLQLLAQPAGPGAPRVGRLVVPGPRNTSDLDPGFARWAADHGLDIELTQAGQAVGEFSFDPLLRDLAAHADKATARSTAKNTEYPTASGRAAQISETRDLTWTPASATCGTPRSPAHLAAPVAGDRFARPGSRRADSRIWAASVLTAWQARLERQRPGQRPCARTCHR